MPELEPKTQVTTGDWMTVGAIAAGTMVIAAFFFAIKTLSMSTAMENRNADTRAASEATQREARARRFVIPAQRPVC